MNDQQPLKEGKGLLIIGLGGSGKTTLALDETAGERRIIVAPDVTNPAMVPMPKIGDSNESLDRIPQYMDGRKELLIMLEDDNPEVFTYLLKHGEGYTIVLDDIATFLEGNWHMVDAFKKFIRKIRWKHIRLVMTTHRLKGDVPPVARTLARQIWWVGPMEDEKTAQDIYGERSVKMHPTFEGFFNALQALEPYDWKTKKREGTVLVVKKVD